MILMSPLFLVAIHPVLLKVAGFEGMNKTLEELECPQDQTFLL